MKEIPIGKNCLICGEPFDQAQYVCERGEGKECVKYLHMSIFATPHYIPREQRQQFVARIILKNKERVLNEIGDNRRHPRRSAQYRGHKHRYASSSKGIR